MSTLFFYQKKKFFILKCCIILVLFWLSINTGSKYLTFNYLEVNDIGIVINLIRSIFPYFFIIFYFAVMKNFNKIKFNNFDSVFVLFFLYGIFQLSGLIYYFDNMHEHYWIVCLFSLLLFFNHIQKTYEEKIYNFIFVVNIIAIFFIFSSFVFIAIKENIYSNYPLYNSLAFTFTVSHEQIPRSSGLSRMALILFVFFNSLYFSKSFSVKKSMFFLIAIIVFVSILLLLQSRSTIISFLLIFIGINFMHKFINIKERIKYFMLIILLPAMIFISYPFIKSNLVQLYEKKDNVNIQIYRSDFFLHDSKKDFFSQVEKISNNRILAWEFLMQVFFNGKLNDEMEKGFSGSRFQFKNKKNYLTGYGPQADRHFMKDQNLDKKKSTTVRGPYGQTASNGYIYSLICSGIIGLITFVLLNLIIFSKIIKIIFVNKYKNFNRNPFLTASIFCVLFLQFRLLFENSFSVFGVDMLILLSSYLIIQNEFKKIKN